MSSGVNKLILIGVTQGFTYKATLLWPRTVLNQLPVMTFCGVPPREIVNVGCAVGKELLPNSVVTDH
jgi:hypothetical protein